MSRPHPRLTRAFTLLARAATAIALATTLR